MHPSKYVCIYRSRFSSIATAAGAGAAASTLETDDRWYTSFMASSSIYFFQSASSIVCAVLKEIGKNK